MQACLTVLFLCHIFSSLLYRRFLFHSILYESSADLYLPWQMSHLHVLPCRLWSLTGSFPDFPFRASETPFPTLWWLMSLHLFCHLKDLSWFQTVCIEESFPCDSDRSLHSWIQLNMKLRLLCISSWFLQAVLFLLCCRYSILFLWACSAWHNQFPVFDSTEYFLYHFWQLLLQQVPSLL